jgi:light-regulated signal transduction histidine kinase (bacteriophytochrome)
LGELDPTGSKLAIKAATGWPDRLVDGYALELADGGQESESVRTGRPIFLESADENSPIGPSREARAMGIVASATVPIRGKDEMVGLLHIGLRQARRFSQDDVAFLRGIGTIMGMAIDRHRRAQPISRLNLQLQQRDGEHEAVSYSVAHDLRAPLRAVAGFATALDEDYASSLDEEGRRFLGLITAGAERMTLLIDALLSLARVSRQEFSSSTVDLSAIASSIVTDLHLADPERHVLAKVEPGIVAVGDPALLRNVLANLIGNAWKFTRTRDPALIRFEATAKDGETIYSISDNGIGFATKHEEELFVPFKRLHGNEFEGTGIGLATVARIVHRHGGRVWAKSEPGSGTTFFFTLGDQYE